MSLALWLAGSLVVGFVLGLLFFGGLWLTVRKVPTARHPALLTLGSFWGRTVVVIAGFYLLLGGPWVELASGHWERLLAGLAGFIAVRTILVRRVAPEDSSDSAAPAKSR